MVNFIKKFIAHMKEIKKQKGCFFWVLILAMLSVCVFFPFFIYGLSGQIKTLSDIFGTLFIVGVGTVMPFFYGIISDCLPVDDSNRHYDSLNRSAIPPQTLCNTELGQSPIMPNITQEAHPQPKYAHSSNNKVCATPP